MNSDETDIEVETVDVDEIVRQERVRSIFEAKRETREARTKASNEEAVGDSNAGAIIYRNALETYIREVEPLFSQTKKGRQYWRKRDFGEVELRPRHRDHTETSKETGVIQDAGRVDDGPNQLEVQGLKFLSNVQTPIRTPFKFVTRNSRGWNNNLEAVETVTKKNIPIQVLDKMYAVTNGYLAEIGFGVEVGKAEQHTKLDDELLAEVEAWRRENL